MGDSYDKRARAKRKQQERRRKLERKRNQDEGDEPKEEISGDEYLLTPEDRDELAAEEAEQE